MKKIGFTVLPRSKPILGFNDSALMVAGCSINTIIMMSLLYKDMFLTGPYDTYIGLFIGVFIYMAVHWYLMRLFYLRIVSTYSGYENRFRRMIRLPLVLAVYLLVTFILDFLLDPILKIKDPEHQKPALSIELISGTVLAIIDIGIYESLHVFVELKNTKIEKARLEKDKATTSLANLKNQMNPDFLFKNLKRLELLIDQDSEKATTFLYQLSKVYKAILEVSDKKIIPVMEELNYICDFISLLNEEYDNQIFLKVKGSTTSKKGVVPLSLHIIVEDLLSYDYDKNKGRYFEVTQTEHHLEIKNSLKEEQFRLFKNSIALNHLKNRYHLLTQKSIELNFKNSFFVLKLPLLDR